jgi:hypothetical protein
MNRALHIGDKITLREEHYEQVRRQNIRLAKMDWAAWSKSGIPLAIADEYTGGRSNRRRTFLAEAPNFAVIVYPCEIKLDDREHRKKVHDQIWAERRKERAARQRRIKGRKKHAYPVHALHQVDREYDMHVVPLTFRKASEFVATFHRHNKPPVGCKFCIGVEEGGVLEGVAQCGRPVSRAFDNGLTLEINRTCTNGKKNANSMLYGACSAIAKAMGYHRIITYTQAGESGASLRAVGFVKVKDLEARKDWAASSGPTNKGNRKEGYAGNVARSLWEIVFGASTG